MYSTSIHHS